MEAELSSEVGAVGRLFKSCVDLYWALLQRILILKFKDRQKEALRDVFGKFYFWGDGFYPFEGRLDEILVNSSRLRNRVLAVLVEVGEILCSEKTGLFALVGKTFDDDKLNGQRQEVRALIEGVQESLEEAASSDSDSGSDASDPGNQLEEIIGDLQSRNQCLIDLSSSLERPAADANLEEAQATTGKAAFKISGPAEIWTRKVIDSYPEIIVTLAERLGEANWNRYQRVSKTLNDAGPVENDSESEDTDDESDGLGDLPDFTETTKSSADPSSIFSSVGGQTNTTGTSVSNNAFDYAFPVARKRLVAKDLKSQATYTSVMTNDEGERGWLKIPAMPKAVELGKTFRCTVCGDKQKDIINQTEWKKHVFTDLQPYICTFQDCKGGIDSFATRKAWADHEFSVHRTTNIWTCNDCAARFSEKASYREHAYSSHGNVLMRNQLEALVNSAETRVGISEDNLCPFCSENPGTKSRAFAMHVGRHMEEVALAVLPRDSEFEDDHGSAGSSIDSSSLKDRLDDPPEGAAPPIIEALEESNLSNYDAQMFCALKLYVLDSAGQHLSHKTICSTVGVTPKDPNGNTVPSDVIVPYIMKHRPAVYSAVTTKLKDYWEPKAKETYAEWLKSTTVRDRAPTEQQPNTRTFPPIEDGTAGSRVGIGDFNFLATIGKGNFSKVMLAEKKVSKALFAIKVIKKEFIIENDEVPSVKVEKSVFLKATQEKHPFIIHLQAAFQTETRLYFVMEYVSGGDLMLHIQRGQFGSKRAQFYAAEVCLALKWLHEKHILYRDVKLDNVLLGKDGHIKIADFGLCKESMPHGTKTRTFCGTPEFMPPEVLLDKEYGLPLDWWAFGVLVYQMLLQQSPFRGENEDEIYDAILSDEPLYPVHMPRDSSSLIQQLLVREPEMRLGSGPEDALEVMRHPFFKGINWDDLYHKRTPVPFVPQLQSDTDVSNFDNEFTSVTPVLTPVQSVLTEAMQREFQGFSVVVPP